MKRRLALLFTVVAAGCAHEQAPVVATPPPPKSPWITGKFDTVTRTDIRDALAVIRARLRKEYGTALPIYQLYIIDHDSMSFKYWQHDTETYAYAKRVGGRWQIDEEEAERTIVQGANLPTG